MSNFIKDVFNKFENITSKAPSFNNQIEKRLTEVFVETLKEYNSKNKNQAAPLELNLLPLFFHINSAIHIIKERPLDFERNIFKACKEGKLLNLQWLIEIYNNDIKQRVDTHDAEIWRYRGDTILHIAACEGHLQILEYLIEKQKADVNMKGFLEKTPLHYACEKGDLEVTKYLVSKKADLNAKDIYNEYTPLHCASLYGHGKIVKFLLENGANINEVDAVGKTPFDRAKNSEIQDILKSF